MSFCCRWWRVLLQRMLIWHLQVKTLMNFIGLNLVGTSYNTRSSFESSPINPSPCSLPLPELVTSGPGGSVSLLAHNYTQNVAIITLSSLTHHSLPDCAVTRHPPVTKTGSNCDTDRHSARNLSFSYLSIQTLIVLCPYWITGKLSLNLERKISFHSDDNYQFPILFNLYKMWNLLIWVKLLRQRNTPHVLFCFQLRPGIATAVLQQYLALKTTSTLDYFSKYG